MHTTNSVDYVMVLDGDLWLELDDGQLTRLGPGDAVAQNGTRHARRNLSAKPATIAVVQVGAGREG
jgi:quercetin dioxygenase-like cupin family protein